MSGAVQAVVHAVNRYGPNSRAAGRNISAATFHPGQHQHSQSTSLYLMQLVPDILGKHDALRLMVLTTVEFSFGLLTDACPSEAH